MIHNAFAVLVAVSLTMGAPTPVGLLQGPGKYSEQAPSFPKSGPDTSDEAALNIWAKEIRDARSRPGFSIAKAKEISAKHSVYLDPDVAQQLVSQAPRIPIHRQFLSGLFNHGAKLLALFFVVPAVVAVLLFLRLPQRAFSRATAAWEAWSLGRRRIGAYRSLKKENKRLRRLGELRKLEAENKARREELGQTDRPVGV